MQRHADYGYDAPYALIIFAALGTVCVLVALGALWRQRAPLALAMGLYGALFLGNAFSFLYTTRRGKFIVWRQVLDGLRLRGDERVLDRDAAAAPFSSQPRTG